VNSRYVTRFAACSLALPNGAAIFSASGSAIEFHAYNREQVGLPL
jgi:hypothetical protein